MEPAVRLKKGSRRTRQLATTLLSRVSTFNEEVERKEKTRDDGVQVNTKSEEIERVWKVAEALDQQMDFLEQELQHSEALMKLPSEKEGSLDSDSECYSYRMPIANVIETPAFTFFICDNKM